MRALYLAPVVILLAALWFFFRTKDSSHDTAILEGGGAELADAGLGADALMPLMRAEPAARRRAQGDVAELRAAIRAARSERVREAAAEGVGEAAGMDTSGVGGAGGAVVHVPPEEDTERVGRLDPEYIRDAIRELQPLLRECYELALGEARREGQLAPEGRLVTRFVIGGEPDVGGVIEESEVMDESDLRHPLLEECFTQTLFTVELPAPEEGGRVTVHYPFVLQSTENE